ncbi:MAG: FAD binding domain-containing protein [Spirochaetales bacterium]|nr:FAD binding domain-containing protein [Spirochaetales bacterium]
MYNKAKSSIVYIPKNLGELFQIYNKFPNALIYAGGTYLLLSQNNRTIKLPSNVISLQRVDEMQKLKRTERFLEIGAAVTINRILEKASGVMPNVLRTALLEISNPAVRNIATIGGNLCVSEKRMNSYPVLFLLDTKLELKRSGQSRWVDIRKFLTEDNRPDIRDGEILTRIRVPFEQWNYQKYYVIGDRSLQSIDYFLFCSLGKIEKEQVSHFKFVLAQGDNNIYRSRTAEDFIVGRKFPLNNREISTLKELFIKDISSEHVIDMAKKDKISNILQSMFLEPYRN